MKRIALGGVLVLLLLLVGLVLAVWQSPIATAADPSPQTVQNARFVTLDAGTVRYSASQSWTEQEAAFYGVADIYYSLAISDTSETVTVTLRHSPDCSTLWKNYSTATYTTTQAIAAGTVFTRVANYGGCLGVNVLQSNTATTSPVTTTISAVLKNN